MKNDSSRRGVLPVSEPGIVWHRRLRSEPSPTLSGLPGHPWRPPLRTQDEALARPVPPAHLRPAHDPLGRGWVRRKLAVAVPRPSRLVKGKSPGRARRPGVRLESVATPIQVRSVPSLVVGVAEVDIEATVRQLEAVWSGPTASRDQGRRVELLPAARLLPRILFTGDAPPPGFEIPGGAATPIVELETSTSVAVGVPVSAGATPMSGAGSARLTDAPGEVWLTARDPFMVVAHWERELPQPDSTEGEWGRGRWWMRLHEGNADGPVVTERPATEASGTVLLPVNRAGQTYVAELGYDSHRSGWHGVAISNPMPTPPDRPSVVPEMPANVQWGIVEPWEAEPDLGYSGGHVAGPVPVSVCEPGAAFGTTEVRVEEVWEDGPAEKRGTDSGGALRWSWALWSGAGLESSGKLAANSPDAGDAEARKGRRVRQESIGLLPLGLSEIEACGGASGELAKVPDSAGRRDFWFRVNAEVILHGSTEPDARVTIAGRPVALRPDGSFSFRFAFPDGNFRLPIEAVSADGLDGRKAAVRFLRATTLEGDVGVHPVPPAWDAALEEWGA